MSLQKETKEMEMRLKALQERMERQQSETHSKSKQDTRWKSSSVDKGSMRSYGKEIKDRHIKMTHGQVELPKDQKKTLGSKKISFKEKGSLICAFDSYVDEKIINSFKSIFLDRPL